MNRPCRSTSALLRLLPLLFLLVPSLARAIEPVQFEAETLDNGLRVIYAPLHQAPVVHVRVVYHVGSKNERPDREGFAHMFEHMMFRGSAHVAPQEHMQLIGNVGGDANAFTEFDTTTYVNTLPSNQLELALWLEADRMSSFKVSEEIFKTERQVVSEEWRLDHNQPYGDVTDLLLPLAFKVHPYRWDVIGNMQQLAQAKVEELQDFFNTYYVPNNATLVVAGDIDVAQTKQLVRKYLGWVPKGAPVPWDIPQEPPQTESRRKEVNEAVPLPLVLVGFHTPDYRSDDNDALNLLSTILGDGDSSRLSNLIVHNESPIATQVISAMIRLDDSGGFGVGAVGLVGKDADDLERAIDSAIKDIIDHGVTDAELEKAKTQYRIGKIKQRQTAEGIATELGLAAVLGHDPNRVNTELAKVDAISTSDLQAVAKKYLQASESDTLIIKPSLTAAAEKMMTAAAAAGAGAGTNTTQPAPVAPSTRPVVARQVQFPSDYPTKPPVSDKTIEAHFAKGTEQTIDGVRVIVMSDHRLPIAGWTLTIPVGGHAEPKGSEGLAKMTATLLTRGAGDMSFEQLSEDLEAHGIDLNATDGGDNTRISASCTTAEIDRAMQRTRQVLLQPMFDAEEFDTLKSQGVSNLQLELEDPAAVASRELNMAIYGDTPLGRQDTLQSLKSLTLDQVKEFYNRIYSADGALLVMYGDVTPEQGFDLAKKLLDGWKSAPLPKVDYTLPPPATSRQVLLVDNPGAKQTVIEMATRAFDVHSDEKYAGDIASTVLSSGIESRLGQYVRAKKGLAYDVNAYFEPARHAGVFHGSTQTAVESSADAIGAMFDVIEAMRTGTVTPTELADAKRREGGYMVLRMQTIETQARQRGSAMLNGFPDDYYDQYPRHLNEVTEQQVLKVMDAYAKPDAFTIIVVAPASAVKDKLTRFGQVKVIPMPSHQEQ